MKRRAFLLCVGLVIAVVGRAEQRSGPPPWAWGAGERIRERYDPAHARARGIAARERCGGNCADSIVVDGAKNPELLMPAELMDTLAGAYDTPDPAVRANARQLWLRRVSALNLPATFWTDLYAAGQPFFDASIQFQEITQQLQAPLSESDRERLSQRRNEISASICQLRARALASARKTFGRDVFDRFLYEAIAPGVFVIETPGQRPVASWNEDECQ